MERTIPVPASTRELKSRRFAVIERAVPRALAASALAASFALGCASPAEPVTGSPAPVVPNTPVMQGQTPVGGASGAPRTQTPPVAIAGATAPAPTPIAGAGGPGGGVVSPPPIGGSVAPTPGGGGDLVKLEGACPAGFMPKEGTNTDFPSGGKMRQFVVNPPTDTSKPLPLLMVLTGTVESTTDSMESHSRLTKDLVPKGWLLVGPVRQCSNSPMDANQACNAAGTDGWNWKPWNEGAAAGGGGMKWWGDEGPDAKFMKEMVQCVATKWPVDAKRLFVTGISSGGTMTNRLLTFQSDFWAGGVPQSGEWYVEGGNQVVAQAPDKIVNGRCCPLPMLKPKLDPMFIITSWGGPTDMWMGLSDYSPTCQAASNYYSSQEDVTHVSCSGMHGHKWQPVEGFNVWFADQLMAHPKGSTVAPNNTKAYMLPSPAPTGYTCEVGRFTKIYGK